MSKVITFSRYFPSYHPRKGEPTWFIEKIWAGLADITDFMQPSLEMDWYEYYNGIPKWHTIRSGNRWEVGDKFSPRVWSGKPYASKQIIISPDIEIKKVWYISFDNFSVPSLNGIHLFDEYNSENWDFDELAQNDGLSPSDAVAWFKPYKETVAQIICWNEKINY